MKTMILFLIGTQQVYQIPYNGCTGQDEIDDKVELVARHYKIPEQDVRIQFEDEELEASEKIVSWELKDDLNKEIKEVRFQN